MNPTDCMAFGCIWVREGQSTGTGGYSFTWGPIFCMRCKTELPEGVELGQDEPGAWEADSLVPVEVEVMPYTTHMENGRQVAGHLQNTSDDCVYCLRIFIAAEKQRAETAEEKLVHWEMGTADEDCPYQSERDTVQEALVAAEKKVLSKETLALIIWATEFKDFGDLDFSTTWEHCVESWGRVRKLTEDDHDGECTGESHACVRCQYEYIMTLAGKVVEAIGV